MRIAQTEAMPQRRRSGVPRAAAWQSTEPDDLQLAVQKGVVEIGGAVAWKELTAVMVRATNMPKSEAELSLAIALALALVFNWKAWYRMKCPAYVTPGLPPHPNKVQDAFHWLQDGPLHLSPDELRVALEKCDNTYMTDPKSSYFAALSTAPEQFCEPDAFRALLLGEPHALRLTYKRMDIDPDREPIFALGELLPCDGECRRSWHTHAPQ